MLGLPKAQICYDILQHYKSQNEPGSCQNKGPRYHRRSKSGNSARGFIARQRAFNSGCHKYHPLQNDARLSILSTHCWLKSKVLKDAKIRFSNGQSC